MRTHAIRHVLLASLVACAALAACDGGQDPSAPAVSAAPPATEAPAATPIEAPAESPTAPTPETKPATKDVVAEGSAELGKPAIDFTLTAVDGTTHTLSDYAGKTVVLEWFNPDCPFVKAAYQGVLKGMGERVASDEIAWLRINSGGPGKQGNGLARNQQASTEHGFANPLLLDESGIVGKAYGASNTPHLYLIDPKGVLVYRGAIDNAPFGKVDTDRPTLPDAEEGATVNYIEAALEDLKAGRDIRLPETKAYGCSVKYAS